MSVDIKSRNVWSTQEPRWLWKLHLPANYVFTSFTYSSPCFTENNCIQEIKYLDNHATRLGKCPMVRYNFLIGGNGTIFECRGWYQRPGLPPKYKKFNKRSIYIGFIGIFKDFPPSNQMYKSQDNLIQYGIENSLISKRYLAFTVKPAGRGILTKV